MSASFTHRALVPHRVLALKQFLGQHLGPQFHSRLEKPHKAFTEAEKFEFLPLLFSLMPRQAAMRSSAYVEIKPIIKSHFEKIGLSPADELLVDLVKQMCDNFDRSQPSSALISRYRPRKGSIAELRFNAALYKKLRQSQMGRCAICGVEFGAAVQETLDHIIPWRLGGDPAEGTNWQIVCRDCNDGKATLLSSYATNEYVNWVYADTTDLAADLSNDQMSLRTRYLALSHYRRCQIGYCNKTPKETRLFVTRNMSTGFSVFEYLSVLCEEHVATVGHAVLGLGR